jgi:IS30 family transposase
MGFVLRQLKEGWAPEQIAGRLRHVEHPDEPALWISHESIYRYVWADKANGGKVYEYLRRGKKRYRKRGRDTQGRGQIPDRVSIDERPAEVNERQRFGDWEGDTIVGKNMKGYIATFVERKSRYTVARVMKDKRAKTLNTAALRGLAKIPPALVRTLTFDNGKEFAGFKKLEQQLSAQVYFAHPYSSWERGTNENTNGLLRQYVPKETDITTVKPATLNAIIERLNNRPRKSLNYRTPNEVLLEAIVALDG